MKIETRKGIGTKITLKITCHEAIGLLAVISDQLYQRQPPSGRTEIITEDGKRFDVRIDFDKE